MWDRGALGGQKTDVISRFRPDCFSVTFWLQLINGYTERTSYHLKVLSVIK